MVRWFAYKNGVRVSQRPRPAPSPGSFDEGLQMEPPGLPTPFVAYSSDRGGKYEIWIQQISGGDPIQITKGPGQNGNRLASIGTTCLSFRRRRRRIHHARWAERTTKDCFVRLLSSLVARQFADSVSARALPGAAYVSP